MNVLVTGGFGFIGSSLVEKLLLENYSVVVLDNLNDDYSLSVKIGNSSLFLNDCRVKVYIGDIGDKSVLEKIFKNNPIDIVVHLAAIAGVRESISNPYKYFANNLLGTTVLLQAIMENGIRKVVFSSSSSVYGELSRGSFSEYEQALFPRSPYALSKYLCERICAEYSALFNINIFSLRFFTVYGPRQRPDMAISKFITRIIDEKELHIFGTGESMRDYTYIDDVVWGIIRSIEVVRGFEIINIGSSNPISLMDLVSQLEKIIGKKAIIKFLKPQDGDVHFTNANIIKASSLLGYEVKVPLISGLEKTVKYFNESRI